MEEVDGFKAFTLRSRSCARSVARIMLKRVRRDRSVVADEYHRGHWARVLERRAWDGAFNLEAFLVGDDDREIFARAESRVHRTRVQDYYRYRLQALPKLLEEMIGGRDGVVELGSGFGYNLFALSLAWPGSTMTGLELSENGLEAAGAIAGHFRLGDRLQFNQIDLTVRGHPGFASVRGRPVFTFFCLEQIPYDIEAVVANILDAQPSRIVNIEPSIDMFRPYRFSDWPNYLYVKSVDYQTRLTEVLASLEARGRIRIVERRRMPFSPTIQNEGLAVAWEPV